MKKVYCFDFDGTLTTADTLLRFIRFTHGWGGLYKVLLRYSVQLVLMKLGLYPNYKAKQHVFAHLYAGWRLDRFNDACQRFAAANRALLRPQGMQTVAAALQQGSCVLIVSASIDNWVSQFFAQSALPHADQLQVVGTQIEVENDVITGRFLTPNCYGQEKVRRIEQELTQPRDSYYLVAYGDNKGDQQMLRYADEAHYKPFRQ